MNRTNHFDEMVQLTETFLSDGGLKPENVKTIEVDKTGRRTLFFQFFVLEKASYIIKLYEVADSEGRFLPYIHAEIGLGRLENANSVLAYKELLEWNRTLACGVKACSDSSGIICVTFRERLDLVNLYFLANKLSEMMDYAQTLLEKLEPLGLESLSSEKKVEEAVRLVN